MINFLDLLQATPALLILLTGIVGMMVGSFLNVVIYRLPIMMQRDWRKECHSFLGLTETQVDTLEQPFNLMLPLSRCPSCQTAIKPYHNIPLFSYILLKGRCGSCRTKIALRYPLVEAFTGICSMIVAWQLGFGSGLIWALLLTWSLIALSCIDFDHQLLPDSITLPMLWLGLLLSEFGIFTTTDSSIIGAIAGYLSLWIVYQLFKLTTGKEGMGYGDFKLLALFGAWLGWQYLPLIILLSSLTGAVIGIGMILLFKRDRALPMPFGPYLAIAGWIALLWGGKLNLMYLGFVGL